MLRLKPADTANCKAGIGKPTTAAYEHYQSTTYGLSCNDSPFHRSINTVPALIKQLSIEQ